jgi:DNA-cytosine methyltransferase
VDTTKHITHLSLCTGYGGIDIGLARACPDIRTIAYSEIEVYALENLVNKMEKGILAPAPIWSNLKTFPFKDFYGKVDILSGGFPCQPFSAAGQRNGDTDPRHLFPFIKQGIIDCRPAFVFLENVRGLLSSKLQSDHWADPQGTPVLLHILRDLERIGYEAHWGLFSARETGLPHLRQRVFILGKRKDITNGHIKASAFYGYLQNSGDTILDEGQDCMDKNKANKNPSTSGIDNQGVILQRFAEGARGFEDIKSDRICRPSGRDRRQQFYEPRRTLRRGVNRAQELGNANHNGANHIERSRPLVEYHETIESSLLGSQKYDQGVNRAQGVENPTAKGFLRHIEEQGVYSQGSDEREPSGQYRISSAEFAYRTGERRDEDIRGNEEILESSMGGNADGLANWLDYERLCESYTSLIDEIRLLGNGVVPATAERAFITLLKECLNEADRT